MTTRKTTGITKLPTTAEKMSRLESAEAKQFISTGSIEPEITEESIGAEEMVGEGDAIPRFPWIGASPKHLKLTPLRMPEDESMMLKFIGETTYGESANSIMLAAVRKEIVKRLRDRGFKVSQDRKGKITSVQEIEEG